MKAIPSHHIYVPPCSLLQEILFHSGVFSPLASFLVAIPPPPRATLSTPHTFMHWYDMGVASHVYISMWFHIIMASHVASHVLRTWLLIWHLMWLLMYFLVWLLVWLLTWLPIWLLMWLRMWLLTWLPLVHPHNIRINCILSPEALYNARLPPFLYHTTQPFPSPSPIPY